MTTVGFVPYTGAAELAQIQQVFTNVFGSGVNLNPTSVNGVLIQQLTNMGISSENVQSSLYASVYNPNVAQYPFLDSICAWNNITRKSATQSVVICQITGLSGTIIPVNSQVISTNGDLFYNQVAITIASGVATGIFYSVVAAPIPCNSGTLTGIVQQIPGWDTITNADNGTVGTVQQTDTSLRYTRKYSLAQNSTGTYDSIVSACYQTPDISNFYLATNNTPSPAIISGVTVPGYGIYLSIFGGNDQEIAAILYNKLSGGTAMGGSTNYTYVDPSHPWVSFNASWEAAIGTPIEVDISILNSASYPVNIVQLIQAAVVANFYGEDNVNTPVQMGVTMYAIRFIPTLINLGITQITSCLTCVVSGTPSSSLLLPITECPTLATINVNVTVIG